ncbi:MAG: hypothetical protein Q7J57_08805, partial [Gemmobacter sp.]|nr:hypothetical protein [Gemmobacter sp.]
MTRYVLISAALLFVLPPATVWSQAAPPVVQAPTAPSAADLVALNFYLQQQDRTSADAELRRLRAKFPGWAPPADLGKLSVTQPSTEIDTIYSQIAAGQLAQARATIAATQDTYEAWQVPPDMMRLLETAEGQILLDAALDAGNAAQALEIASRTDGLLRCDRVNNAWRIAKAQESQQALEAAIGTYRAVVMACTNFPDVVATLEKSASIASVAELTGLFDAALSRFPSNAADLDSLRARLLQGLGAAPATIAIRPEAKARPRSRPSTQASAGATVSAPAQSAGPVQSARSSGSGAQCLAATEGSTSAARLAER